jgi:hypothetical protein
MHSTGTRDIIMCMLHYLFNALFTRGAECRNWLRQLLPICKFRCRANNAAAKWRTIRHGLLLRSVVIGAHFSNCRNRFAYYYYYYNIV